MNINRITVKVNITIAYFRIRDANYYTKYNIYLHLALPNFIGNR